MALAAAGCGASGQAAAASSAALASGTEGLAYTLLPGDVKTPVTGNGAKIALVVDSGGLADGANNAAAWDGVQKFCRNFGFTAQSFVAADASVQGAEDALRAAAESGAGLVVCMGAGLETPLYDLQGNYPTVSFLMLDGEPHTEDYATYETGNATHCVLFREEQAGYLAGYAAVADGSTLLGFAGSETMPGIVRYGTGFLQGAQAAAELNGAQVTIRYWFSGAYESAEDVTDRLSGWYADGTQLVFACGGTMAASCTAAAQQSGGKVIASDYDQSALGGAVVSSAVKAVSRAAQNTLYAFYANGGSWGTDGAGQTEQLGVSAGAVALTTANWNFVTFTRQKYETLYGQLLEGKIKVGRYSDMNALPETQNVAVDLQT